MADQKSWLIEQLSNYLSIVKDKINDVNSNAILLRQDIDNLKSLSGYYVGDYETIAEMPITPNIKNGDYAILKIDDGLNKSGFYVKNTTGWSFVFDLLSFEEAVATLIATDIQYNEGTSTTLVPSVKQVKDDIDNILTGLVSIQLTTDGHNGAATYNTITGELNIPEYTIEGLAGIKVSQWDAAYGWGDHALAGYLIDFIETDPVFSASPASQITNINITNWDAAYNWGDHASIGYATEIWTNDQIDSAINALINGAGAALNTLNELASALGNDPNFATTISTSIDNKWSKTGNAGTNPSTNFIGTTDNQDVVFRRNNTETLRIKTGSIKVTTSSYNSMLEMEDAFYGYYLGINLPAFYKANRIHIYKNSSQTFYNSTQGGHSFQIDGTTTIRTGTTNDTTDKNVYLNETIGNTLIGTTVNAGFKLDVNGTTRIANTFYVGSSSSDGVNITRAASGQGLITSWAYTPSDPTSGISIGANFGFNGSSNNFYGMGLGSLRNGAYDIWFQTGASNGGGYRWYIGTSEKMTMFNSGNFAINTTTDAGFKLDVNGTGIFRGDLTVGQTTDGTRKIMLKGYTDLRLNFDSTYNAADANRISLTRRAAVAVYNNNTFLFQQASYSDGFVIPYKFHFVNPSSYYAAINPNTGLPYYGYQGGFMWFKDSATEPNLQMKLSPDNAFQLYSSTNVPVEQNFTDGFQLYSRDITAGNAAPHFRTENGSIIKLYSETTSVASSTLISNGGTVLTDTDTIDGYTLKQVVKALRNQGLLT